MQDNSLHQINQRRQKIDPHNGSSNSRRCRWCGRSRLCRRSECPARDRYCNTCHIKGHFEKVCRQDSTRRINKRQPVHKLEDDDDEEDEEEEDEVTSVYSFNTLYNLKAMESEHIRPLWISTTATSQVHKVNVEVDTGADCNVIPVYLFSKIFGSKQPESSDARIQAYGGMPVTIVGKCTVFIHKSDGTQTSAVFQVTHHNGHAIIGRSTSRDIGYVNLPAIECPPLSMAPITHDVQTLQQHVEQPRMHKTQSSTTIDNIRNKGTNNSVADVLSHASPHPHRSTDVRPEDVTPLHVLSDSIPANQSCLDSVQTEAKKDGTLQQPRNCQATQSTRCSQQQEGLSQYEVPAGPWKRLGIDYFKWNQQRYLLIADYYSRFPIIRSVSTMSAAHLVTVLKTIFSEYGLPEELVSDKGTQFTSEQYTSFAEEYNIKITHSSPRYPQSNGFIESMVKITKQILQRCKQTSSDPHMAMLLHRSTPLQSGTESPAELLSQRRYQTTLPIKNREPVRSCETKANVIGTPTGNSDGSSSSDGSDSDKDEEMHESPPTTEAVTTSTTSPPTPSVLSTPQDVYPIFTGGTQAVSTPKIRPTARLIKNDDTPSSRTASQKRGRSLDSSVTENKQSTCENKTIDSDAVTDKSTSSQQAVSTKNIPQKSSSSKSSKLKKKKSKKARK